MSSPPEPPKPSEETAPPPSVRTPPPPPIAVSSEPQPAAPTAAATIEDPPSISLHHSRAPAKGRAWLRVALPLVGLSLVPAVGLIYAATASFGKGADETAADEEAAGVDGGVAKKGKTKGKAPKAAPKPRTDGAAECCAKLRELGKTAPLDARASYLSAAQACESAPDEDRAFKIAKSNVQTAKHELPEECAP